MTKLEILNQELNGEELDFLGDNMGNVFDAMEVYAKQQVLEELENLYSLGCHSEYLRESIKESIDEIKCPRPI
jgi:hypothetical protein